MHYRRLGHDCENGDPLCTGQLHDGNDSDSFRGMDFRHQIIIAACAASFAGVLVGCEPPAQGTADDEMEPNYILGQKRLSAMDYPGAAAAFETSLEANPHSAMAHYQLAMICENEQTNPAVAIYHYEQYLRFDPKASNAEIIAGRIYNCKMELGQRPVRVAQLAGRAATTPATHRQKPATAGRS